MYACINTYIYTHTYIIHNSFLLVFNYSFFAEKLYTDYLCCHYMMPIVVAQDLKNSIFKAHKRPNQNFYILFPYTNYTEFTCTTTSNVFDYCKFLRIHS